MSRASTTFVPSMLLLMSLAASPLFAEPRVFLLDRVRLEAVRSAVANGDIHYSAAIEKLRKDADRAMREGPFTVTDKDVTPPSGDKRDYMSLGPYWWPNPATADGLPYVRRDGERNPEIDKYPDARHMGQMTGAVETLAQGYYFTSESAYAERAALLLRTWFLDEKTGMNPHLEYGQAVRGINTGRGIGIIQTRSFVRIVDAVGMLESSESWTDEDQHALVDWFEHYLKWLTESSHGQDEAIAENNHGTYYDLQVAALALFVANDKLAREVLHEVGPRRIAVQIAPDGRQPLELVRTKSWGYSIGNVIGLMSLAELAEHQGIDLWSYESSEGGSIRKAIDYLLPTGSQGAPWAHQQIGNWSPRSFYPILRFAALKFPDGPYPSLVDRIPGVDPSHRTQLIGLLPGSF